MKGILKYAKPYGLFMFFTLILKFIAAMMDLLIPSFLAKIIDDIVPIGDKNQIFFWGGIMVCCAVCSAVTNISANRMAEISAGNMTEKIRHDLFAKISYLSSRQMDEFTIPSVISRLTSDTYNVNRMLARIQRLGVRGPILLLGGIVITMSIEPKLALVLLAALPVIVLIVIVVTTQSVPVYDKQQGVLDDMVRILRENITGVRVIRALSRTEYEKKRFDEVNDKLAKTEQKAGNISAASNPSTTLVLNMGFAGVILMGAYLVDKGETGPGAIIAFLSYFTIILNAMLGITKIFIMCSKGIASARRITEVLETSEDMVVDTSERIVKMWSENGQMKEEDSFKAAEKAIATPFIEFKNVFFSYLGKKNNLTDISFSLRKGETLGIIGPTGSGKSTIIQLLLRFYDINEGQILVDGRDIRSIPFKELRGYFGVVFQNDYLMATSIEENVDYFRNLDEDGIRQAVKSAQAEEFIKEKQGEMDAMVQVRGNNLSGGQKQRIMIARALAARPEVLILDDASSALDYQTDAKLRKVLSEHYKDTTVVQIAQRISSLVNADRILVLEEGRCMGYGTHESLLKDCELYRQIYELQTGKEA